MYLKCTTTRSAVTSMLLCICKLIIIKTFLRVFPSKMNSVQRLCYVNPYRPEDRAVQVPIPAHADAIEKEGFIQKRRQRSSLLFGGQNLFNSLPL